MTDQIHDLRLVRQLRSAIDIAGTAEVRRERLAKMDRVLMRDREERRRVDARRLIVERTRNAADQCAHCGKYIAARSLLAIIPARGVVMHTECASGGRV